MSEEPELDEVEFIPAKPCTECAGSGEGPDEITHGNEVTWRKCKRCDGKGLEPNA